MIRFITISAGLVGLSAFGGIGLATAHGYVFEDTGRAGVSELTSDIAAQSTLATAPEFAVPALPEAEPVVTASLTKLDSIPGQPFAPNGAQDVLIGSMAFAPVTSPAPRGRDDVMDVVAQSTFSPRPVVSRPSAPVVTPTTTQSLQSLWLLGVFR
jgi:hypothetical protein